MAEGKLQKRIKELSEDKIVEAKRGPYGTNVVNVELVSLDEEILKVVENAKKEREGNTVGAVLYFLNHDINPMVSKQHQKEFDKVVATILEIIRRNDKWFEKQFGVPRTGLGFHKT